MPRCVLALLLAAFALAGSANGQAAAGYSTAPYYVNTFDRIPTAAEKGRSTFTYVPSVQQRTGAVLINRVENNYINLLTYPDNYGRTVPSIWGGETSVEAWIMARDFVNWQRIFEASTSPTNATTGEINGNPTSDNYAVIWSPTSAAQQIRYTVATSGTGNTQVVTPAGTTRVGDWVHVAVVSEALTPLTPTAANAGFNSIYINGILTINGTGYLPRNVSRNLVWAGRSAAVNNNDAYFHGFMDSIAMYGYPLSPEAIFAHMKVDRPPVFELVFNKNPSVITGATAPTFGWVQADGSSNGVLTLSGTTQSVNLLTASGASSVGTTMVATQGGASSGTPTAPGWSYTAIVKFGALTPNSAIFDFKDATTNRVRMYLNAAGSLAFSWNTATATSNIAVVTGRFYHLAATVSRTGAITLYIDNSTAASTTGTVAAITFTTAFLGQSNDATVAYLNGRIDAVRIYDIALTSAQVQALTSTIGNQPNGLGSTAVRPLTTIPSSAPVVAYTFDNPPGPLGTEGFSNWTWVEVRQNNVDRTGIAYLDGTNGMISIVDTPDNEGRLHPTYYGGAMSFETRFQFYASSNQAMVFSLFGPKSMSDNNIHMMNTYWQANGQTNSYKFEVYGGTSSSAAYCYGCTNGSWAHAIVSISQPNPSDSISSTSGRFDMYVNGQAVWSGLGYLPWNTHRPNAYLGVSGWASDAKFFGNLDSYFMYNYALSAEAAAAHAALPVPPIFETVFSTSPVVAGSAFGWVVNNSADASELHNGWLTLTGTQYVNFSATSGANFVGFTIPSVMGTGRNTPGVLTSQQQGWSFHIVFRATATTAGQTVLEFADSTGANALKLAITASGLTFTSGSATINCGAIFAGVWTDVLITIVQDRELFEGQCYVNGARTASVPSYPAIPTVSRNSVLLGRSNTGTGTNFAGDCDQFRVMAFALNSEDAYQLFAASSKIDPFFNPPAFTSGPRVSYTFDVAPQESTDPSNQAVFNFYNWDRVGPSYAASANHTGVVVFNGTGNSNALRQYIDATFDQDAYGVTMPQVYGGSMSFEMWICMGSPTRPGQALFDFADNPGTDWNGAQGAGQYNILMASALTGSANLLNFESFHVPQQSTAVTADVLTPGTWQHVTGVIAAGATGQSTATIYVNGVPRASGAITTPPARLRRSSFIGRSNWDRPALNAVMDSFYFYDYALDQSQIQMHMIVPYPPMFDASFSTNPLFNTAGSNYGFLAVDPTSPSHVGVLTFNGFAQFVDLNAGTGAISIGQYMPLLNGPSVGSPDQAGFTFELSLKWTDLTNNRKVFDISNAAAVDSFAFGTEGSVVKLYTQNGLTDEKTNITMFTATANVWYHVVITASRIAGSNDTMTYTLYLNGVRSTSTVGWAPLPIIRRTSYLGRSTETPTGPTFWFAGSLDLMRYYAYVPSADVIRSLYQLTTVVVVPTSSSSTGVARSSSSSAVVIPSSTSSAAPVQCRGAGYDFSSLVGTTLILDANSGGTNPSYYRYAISPCGTVSQTGLCSGMVCQNTTVLSRWDPSYDITSWFAISGGVNMQVENGAMCGAIARRVDIAFMCSQTATTPIFRSITETTTCRYALTVDTALACTPTGTTGGQQVGDDWYSTQCGGGAYALDSITSQDITGGPFGGYNYSIRLCGRVSNPLCNGVQPVSVCQSQGTSAWKLADYNLSPTLWSLNPNGLNVTSFTGADCGSFKNRTTIVKLVCTTTATTPVIVTASEVTTCTYLYIVNTNAVCGTPFRLPSSSSAAVVPSSSSVAVVPSSSSAAVVPRSSSSSSAAASRSSSSTSTPSTTGTTMSSSAASVSSPSAGTTSETSTGDASTGFSDPDENLNGASQQSINSIVLILVAVIAAIVV